MGNLQFCEHKPPAEKVEVKTLNRNTNFIPQELSRVELPETSFIDVSILLDISKEDLYFRDLLESTYNSIIGRMLSIGITIPKTQIYYQTPSNELKRREYKTGVKAFLEAESSKPYEFKVLLKYLELICQPIPLTKNSMRIFIIVGKFFDSDNESQLKQIVNRLKKMVKNRFSIIAINSNVKVFKKFEEMHGDFARANGMTIETLNLGMKEEWEFIDLMISKFEAYFDTYMKFAEAKAQRETQFRKSDEEIIKRLSGSK